MALRLLYVSFLRKQFCFYDFGFASLTASVILFFYRLDDPAGAAACLDQLALDETAAMIICTSNALGKLILYIFVSKCENDWLRKFRESEDLLFSM